MKLLKKMLLQDNSPPKRKQNFRHLSIYKPITIMKSIKLFFISTILFTISANSQITKGNWMVGGTGSFSFSNTKGDQNTSATKTYDIKLSPNIGYFISDRFSFGSKISYNYSKFISDQGNGEYKNFEIGPFVRYYFLKAEKSTNIFIEPSYTFNVSPNNSNNSTFSTKGGYVVFLNNSVGFEVSIEYLMSKYENSNNTNTILFGVGLQIHLEKN